MTSIGERNKLFTKVCNDFLTLQFFNLSTLQRYNFNANKRRSLRQCYPLYPQTIFRYKIKQRFVRARIPNLSLEVKSLIWKALPSVSKQTKIYAIKTSWLLSYETIKLKCGFSPIGFRIVFLLFFTDKL